MEVHHPRHVTHKKKWTEYLFEFLMLFLAVFCGFMAENFREHLIENTKEKEFVKSLVEDLKKDTARLNYSIGRLKEASRSSDSLVINYIKRKKSSMYEKDMARFGLRTGFSVDVVFNDRTSSQLKGTGSIRLIRNKEVVDSMMQYWNNQTRITQIHDRYENIRIEQRKIGYKTFNWYALNYDYTPDSILLDLHLDDFTGISNKQMVNEFVNACSNLYAGAVQQYIPELETESELAKKLIALIKKEYHLK